PIPAVASLLPDCASTMTLPTRAFACDLSYALELTPSNEAEAGSPSAVAVTLTVSTETLALELPPALAEMDPAEAEALTPSALTCRWLVVTLAVDSSG